MTSTPPTVRDRVVDSAIELLGTQGLKALTHRRIDRHAGVAPGSCSNYFRTRDALLTGVADAILQRELAGAGAGFEPSSPHELVDLMVALLDRTTREQRTLSTARLMLFLEGSHHPVLRAALSSGRAAMAAWLEPVIGRLGAVDPATATLTLMACSEGLILHRIGRHDDADVRPVVEMTVRAFLPWPEGASRTATVHHDG